MLYSATRVLDPVGTRCLAGAVALLFGGYLAGCNGPAGPASTEPVGSSTHALTCNANNGGGDLTCPCTDNQQCNNFDNDSRLIICNVPSGGTVGVCFDCFGMAAGRPVGCFCATNTDCAAGSSCNGHTCQAPVARGLECHLDSDCGTDASGAMSCLPTKRWCGTLALTYSCDFQTDCLAGETCGGLGVCTSGGAMSGCTKDADCTAPLICYSVTAQCSATLADGMAPCYRNAECTSGICNSMDGTCGTVGEGFQCNPANPAGANAECAAGLVCTNCGSAGAPSYNCRPAGSTCN